MSLYAYAEPLELTINDVSRVNALIASISREDNNTNVSPDKLARYAEQMDARVRFEVVTDQGFVVLRVLRDNKICFQICLGLAPPEVDQPSGPFPERAVA